MRIEKLLLKSLDSAAVEQHAARGGGLSLPSLAPEPEQPAPPPPQAITESDLKRAEQEGYRRGFLEGEKEGKMQVEGDQARVAAQLEASVARLSAQMQEVLSAQRGELAQVQKFLPRLALAIARKVAGKALDVNPLPLIEEVVLQCIERILGTPQIIVTVNAALAEPLEEKLAAHFAHNQEPGEITIRGDERVGIADCRIAWGEGQAVRSTEALWGEIERLVNDMIGAEGQRGIAAPAGISAAPPAEQPNHVASVEPKE